MTAITRAYSWLSDGNEITGGMISDIIRENRDRHDTQVKLYERYKGTQAGVPILTRKHPIENVSKVNNKLANDFFGDIVNTKIGYFMGSPISYKYTVLDGEGNIESSQNVDILLQGFLKRNQISDLDAESAKMAAISGYASRLCFINKEGMVEIINVPSWETVFICDEVGISDSDYALRYYTVERGNAKYTRVEFYDQMNISYWIRSEDTSEQDNEFILDPTEETEPHFMGACPLICFPNNEELQGDCERVLSLIDGYDRTLSDVNSEIEQFRLAYMAFYGSVPKQEDLDKLRQTGVIGFPESSDRCEFITKNLNDMTVENHLNRMEENIIYFAQSVRFSDEAFGQASGVAMKFKLFCLESKCKVAERKFTKSLYRQFAVLSGYFDKRGISYDPWDLEFVFTRNFPLNLIDEAQSLATLKGLVSDETAYTQMSFIDDPAKEIERVKAETEDYNQAQADIDAAMDGQNGMQTEGEGQAPEKVTEDQNVIPNSNQR